MRIVNYPHPTLRHKSKPLRRVDSELKAMIRSMLDLMYSREGIGLSANQVDLPYRLFVMNIKCDSAATEEEHVFLNPVIVRRNGQAEAREGCLSFPEIYAPVKRAEKIVLNAYNLKGQELTFEMDGLYARAVQHEIDHLDGVLFIDRLSRSNGLHIKEELEELEAEFLQDRRLGLVGTDEQIAARLAELEAART